MNRTRRIGAWMATVALGAYSLGGIAPSAAATGGGGTATHWASWLGTASTGQRQAAAWLSEYGNHAPATIAVNVSAQQLADTDFIGDVRRALNSSGLSPHRLTIEITESTAVDAVAGEVLQKIRNLGVRISLDDFGTGASTLSLLNNCPVDQIKLDRSFSPVPGSDAIADAVVHLARAFGIEAVAEGVETSDQAQLLTGLAMNTPRATTSPVPCPRPASQPR